jgi:23S rRNA U2552 (ribose-2'-O)-methylase RlmE/FtsJ
MDKEENIDKNIYRKNRDSDWDIYKKYTNPYEYIDTLVPFTKTTVSKHKHLSRSYYKMIEMIHTFNLSFKTTAPVLSSFHLAEGPGGFIEAFSEIRNCKEDVYIGMTILDDKNDANIPAWKKTETFLKKNPNVVIESGADKTGNLLVLENFVYCVEKYGSSMELITGDGGFDFSTDFNNQENNIAKLLFAQICFALCMQKENGAFVLKVFDCFMQHTVDLLYLLSSFYEKVYITKPQTSRYANSEKYIVCKGFLFPNYKPFYSFLYNAFSKMQNTLENPMSSVYRFLNIPISKYFLSKVEEYNAIFGQQQIENIHYTLSLIENNIKQDKINHLIKNNIQKCIQWCIKNNVEYNTSMSTPANNIFLNTPAATLKSYNSIQSIATV